MKGLGGMTPGVVDGGGWGELVAMNPSFAHIEDVEEFRKAVTAGYGTDVATLTGGGALRLQSLESTLLITLQEESDFVLVNKLEKSNAGATVDEYTVKERIGGFPGSAFNSELGEIPEDQGDYQRKTALVKYLMTMRQVSAVQRSQKALIDTMADQNRDATLELLTSLEWACFFGNASCSTVEFDGIQTQLEALSEADRILDLRGASISPAAQEFIESAAYIRGYGNFGRLTDYFCSLGVQADLDQKLDPAYRVNLNGDARQDIRIGTPVIGIRTSFGNIGANPDLFIQEGQAPFEARGAQFLVNVQNAGVTAVTSIAGVAAPNAASQFVTAHAGLYYYGVEAGTSKGRSTLVKSAQVTIAAGDSVTVTITHGASNATYFQIYRGRKNGTDDTDDFREMVRVPRSGGATTVYVDSNQNIPGTSIIALLTMAAGRKAITLRRLLPMTRFPLYPTNKAVYPWAQLLFAYLRLGKVRHHRLIKNVLPSTADWRPFG